MPKIFTDQEKEQIRNNMFQSGFELLKKNGMTHMSVEKITDACGIGKSTFYNFFQSKEDFVLQMVEFRRNLAMQKIETILNGRKKMKISEGKKLFHDMVFSTESIYGYFSMEDLLLLKKDTYLSAPDLQEETILLNNLLKKMDGVKENVDYALTANLLKVITTVMEEKEMLHQEAYERTMEAMLELLYSHIFQMEYL